MPRRADGCDPPFYASGGPTGLRTTGRIELPALNRMSSILGAIRVQARGYVPYFLTSRSSWGDQWPFPENGTAGAGTDTGMKSGLSRSPRDVLLMLLPPYAAARASFHRSACSVVSM